jgi:putative ABC transport system permease protein
MNLGEVMRIAWKSISSNKLRSVLTMLGIIIGVAAVIVMISVSSGTEATIAEQINGLGANLIFISPNFSFANVSSMADRGGMRVAASTLTYDDALAIAEKIKGIAGVSVEQQASETVKYSDTAIDSVTIVGTTPDFPSVREVPLGTGRFLTQNDLDHTAKLAILGTSIAGELFGDADPIGQKITVGTVKLTVVGVMKEKGQVNNTDYDAQIYVPITLVFEKFTPSFFARISGDNVRVIYAQAESKDTLDSVITQIQILMANRHGTTLDSPDVSVTTQQDIIQTQEATSASFRNLLAWVASVSLLVGGIGIMNIMLVSVTERTREIGIRQSMGATPSDIRMQFLTEALILSLIGGVIGILSGIGGSWIFGQTGGMRTVILPQSIALAFVSAAAVGIFFGFIPANKAARLDPIVALRHE